MLSLGCNQAQRKYSGWAAIKIREKCPVLSKIKFRQKYSVWAEIKFREKI